MSDARRQSANEWYDRTLYSRLNDKARSAIVLVMHRLHEDDLAGHVLAQEDWEVVRFPAIAEADETHRIGTVAGPRVFSRPRGEALQPAREPLPMLDAIRRTIGEYPPGHFVPGVAGQYQQAPAPQGGGLVKPVWFRRYLPAELPAAFGRPEDRLRPGASELADFSVCTSWGVKERNLYLLDVLRRHLDYPDLKRAVREAHHRLKPEIVLIEDKASGTQLIQELVAEGLHAVTRYRPQGDKVMRHGELAPV